MNKCKGCVYRERPFNDDICILCILLGANDDDFCSYGEGGTMTNYEVIQTMTVAEMSKFIDWVTEMSKFIEWAVVNATICQLYCEVDVNQICAKTCSDCYEKWLRSDSQSDGGLLTDEMKKFWKVH